MKNDKRFNNRGYSLFFLMGIFLKHLWLIANRLKWRNCKIFTKPVTSQTPSRSSHRRCSVKKDILKNLQNFTGKTCVGVCFKLYLKETPTQLFSSEICEIFINNYFEVYLRKTVSALPRIYKLNLNVFPWLLWRHRFLCNNINCYKHVPPLRQKLLWRT